MISINELARKIINISGKNISIKNVDGPVGVKGRNSDNNLLEEKLGWKPSESLDIGLRKTYEWIDSKSSCNYVNTAQLDMMDRVARCGT
jgi:nucleoside-diphosphate-sugar epimerase